MAEARGVVGPRRVLRVIGDFDATAAVSKRSYPAADSAREYKPTFWAPRDPFCVQIVRCVKPQKFGSSEAQGSRNSWHLWGKSNSRPTHHISSPPPACQTKASSAPFDLHLHRLRLTYSTHPAVMAPPNLTRKSKSSLPNTQREPRQEPRQTQKRSQDHLNDTDELQPEPDLRHEESQHNSVQTLMNEMVDTVPMPQQL